MDQPTELEGVVLALIQRRKEATAYQISRELAESPTRFWSGSAGAVYPLMDRLAGRGLLGIEVSQTGKKKAKRYQLTETGQVACYDWLFDLERASDPGIDPLRVRLLFAASLPAERLAEFLDALGSAIEATQNETPFSNDLDNRLHRLSMHFRYRFFLEARRVLEEARRSDLSA